MTSALDELARTAEKLADLNALRASRIQYRDRQILAALAAGATWAQLQQVTGLSPRGLAMAIKRAKAQ